MHEAVCPITHDHRTAGIFDYCGIDARYVDPVPFGFGVHHLAYRYHPPDKDRGMVVKIPNHRLPGIVDGLDDVRHGIALTQTYFPGYVCAADVYGDQERYCIVMPEIIGTPLTQYDVFCRDGEDVYIQLQDMAKGNRRMMKETNSSLDFVGFESFMARIKDIHGKHPVTLTNVLKEESTGNPKLILIDRDVIQFPHAKRMSLPAGVRAVASLHVNEQMMKRFFAVDIRDASRFEGWKNRQYF